MRPFKVTVSYPNNPRIHKKKKPVIDGLPTMSSSQPENNRHEKTRVIITYNQERKQSIDSDSMCPQILDFTDKYKIHKEFKVKMI